jgi:hypothetical protein
VRWKYIVQWLDGEESSYESPRQTHVERNDDNLIIYINPHGHDQRYDEVIIPPIGVRQVLVEEIL